MSYKAFRGNSNYHTTQISKTLEANMIEFINWGFINAGAFHNVNVPTSGAYGGDFSKLRRSDDPRYTAGTVYEAVRGNLVWESGIENSLQPVDISGVYIDDVLTTSGYNIDYRHGRVIFDSAQSSSSVIKMGYSYKEVNVLSASEHSIPYIVQQWSRRPDQDDFYANSGIYIGLRESNIQLPMVAVAAESRTNQGFEIGGGQIARNTIKCHILAEDDYTAQQIADTLCNQQNKMIRLFDLDAISLDNAFPLTNDGFLSASPLSYPDLVQPTGNGGYLYTNGFKYGKTRIDEAREQRGQWINSNLYFNTVTMITESIVPNI